MLENSNNTSDRSDPNSAPSSEADKKTPEHASAHEESSSAPTPEPAGSDNAAVQSEPDAVTRTSTETNTSTETADDQPAGPAAPVADLKRNKEEAEEARAEESSAPTEVVKNADDQPKQKTDKPELPDPVKASIDVPEPAETKGSGVKAKIFGFVGKTFSWLWFFCKILAVLVILVMVLARIYLRDIIDTAFEKVGAMYQLEISLEDYELSIFAGDLLIRNLKVKASDSEQIFVDIPYMCAEVATTDLLKLNVSLDCFELDGARINVSRDKQKQIEPLIRFLRAHAKKTSEENESEQETSDAEAEDSSEAEGASATPLNFELPVSIRLVQVRDFRLSVIDKAIEPELNILLRTNVWLSQLEFPTTEFPARVNAELELKPLLGKVKFEAVGQNAPQSLAWNWKASVSRIDFDRVRPLVEPFGVTFDPDLTWDTYAAGQLQLNVALNLPSAIGLNIGLENVQLARNNTELVGLDRFNIQAHTLSPDFIHIARVAVQGVRTEARRDSAGVIHFGGIHFDPAAFAKNQAKKETAPEKTQDESDSTDTPEQGSEEPKKAAPAAPLPELILDDLSVSGVQIAFKDAGVSPSTVLAVEVPNATVQGVRFGVLANNRNSFIDATVRLPNVIREINIKGSARPASQEKRFKMSVHCFGISAAAIKPYLTPLGIQVELDDGEVHVNDIQGRLIPLDSQRIVGNVEIGKTIFKDRNHEFAGFEKFALENLRANMGTLEVALGGVVLDGVHGCACRNADNSLSAGGIRIPLTPSSNEASQDKTDKSKPGPESQVPNDSNKGVEKTAAKPGAKPRVKIREIKMRDWHFKFVDDLPGIKTELAVNPLSIKIENVCLDLSEKTKRDDLKIGIDIQAGFPQTLEKLSVKGYAISDLKSPELMLKVRGEELTLNAIKPYVKSLPIELDFVKSGFSVEVKAGAVLAHEKIVASAMIPAIKFSNHGAQVFELIGFESGVEYFPAEQQDTVSVTKLDLKRIALPIELRQKSLSAFGLNVPLEKPKSAATASDSGKINNSREPQSLNPKDPVEKSADKQDPASPAKALPIIKLAGAELGTFELVFTDARGETPKTEVLKLGAKLGGLTVNLANEDQNDSTTFTLKSSVSDILKDLQYSGTVSVAGKKIGLKSKFRANGIDTFEAKNYLDLVGLKPHFKTGAVHFDLDANVELKPTLEADLQLSELVLKEDQQPWVSLKKVLVSPISVSPEAITIPAVVIDEPVARVVRNADESISVAFITVPKPEATIEKSKKPAKRQPRFAVKKKKVPDATKDLSAETTNSKPPVITLASFKLLNAGVDVIDFGPRPNQPDSKKASTIKPRVSVEVADVELNGTRPIPNTTLNLSVRLPGVLEELTGNGTLVVNPADLSTDLKFRSKGLNPGVLVDYLPGLIDLEWQDASIDFDLRARVKPPVKDDKLAAALTVENFRFDNQKKSIELLSFKELTADLAEFNAKTALVHVHRLAFIGLKTSAALEADKSLRALAVHIVPPKPKQPEANSEKTEGSNTSAVKQAAEKPTSPQKNVRRPGDTKMTVPFLIKVDEVDIGIDTVKVTDRTEKEPFDIELRQFSFKNDRPFALFGEKFDSHAAPVFTLKAEVAPVFSGVALTLKPAISAVNPEVDLDVRLFGLSGEKLNTLLKRVKSPLKTIEMRNGEVTGKFSVLLKDVKRKDPLDFGFLSYPFGLELSLENWQLQELAENSALNDQNGAVGQPQDQSKNDSKAASKPSSGSKIREPRRLLGLKNCLVDIRSVTLDPLSVHVSTIDVVGPYAWARKDKDGLRAAGVLIELPEKKPADQSGAKTPESKPTSNPTNAPNPQDSEPKPANQKPNSPLEGVPNFKIDNISIAEVVVDVGDRSVVPPMIAPVELTELTVRPFSKRSLESGRKLSFSLLMRGLTTPLLKPKKSVSDELFGAIDVVGLTKNKDDEQKKEKPKVAQTVTFCAAGRKELTLPASSDYETRDLFSSLRVEGGVAIAPKVAGDILVILEDFQMRSVAGVAKESGVSLGNGELYNRLSLKIERGTLLKIDNRTEITDLDLSEEKGGPIQSALGLGTPINSTIFLLRDEDGKVTLPVDMELDLDDVSLAEVSRVAIKTLGTVIAKSIANVPGRVLGNIGNVVPGNIPFISEAAKKFDPLNLEFQSACVVIGQDLQEKVRELARDLDDEKKVVVTLTHYFSADDLKVVESRTNPPVEAVLDLLARNKLRRKQLQAERATLATRTLTANRLGLEREVASNIEELRRLDRELGKLTLADRVLYEQTTERGRSRAGRRTRKFAKQLAVRRLELVKKLIETTLSGEGDISIRLRPVKFDPGPNKNQASVTVVAVAK